MSGHRRRWIAVSLLGALVTYSVPVVPATIDVNATCTLVDAIHAANNDDTSGGACPPGGAGPDTLVLTGDVVLEEVDNVSSIGPNGLPIVTSDVTVEGNGFVIERAPDVAAFRIFETSASLTLNRVTVRNGSSLGQGGAVAGVTGSRVVLNEAALVDNTATTGGAIYVADGSLAVNDSSLTGNGSEADGGAVSSRSSTVEVSSSVFSGNRAVASGGGLILFGGTATLSNTTLAANEANRGGGLYAAENSVAMLDEVTVAGNSAFDAGGLWNSGNLSVTSSTIYGNFARSGGGGLFNFYTNATLTNSTVSGNTGLYYGGGIENYGTLTLVHTTVTGNVGYDGYGGGIGTLFGSLTLTGSIVADNAGGDCSIDSDFVDAGANFDGDGSCPGAAPIVPGTDFDTTLTDNGGPTLTHALLDGSVAQDSAGSCGLDTDQRGFPRDAACDSGPFELDAALPICGDGVVNQPDEECDGPDDASCPGACDASCLCPPEGACCTDGPGIESDCIVTSRTECEGNGGLFLGEGIACERPVVDCTALVVTMASMSATSTADGVRIRWTTALEVDTVGFRVLRESGGRQKLLTPVGPIVPALGSEVDGGSYEIVDRSHDAMNAAHYFIEDIDLFGRVTRHGPIAVERGFRIGGRQSSRR